MSSAAILASQPHVVTCAQYGQGEHLICSAQWFRSNFGREALR